MSYSKLIILLKSIYYGLETIIHKIKNDKKLMNLNFLYKLFVIRSFYGLTFFRNKIHENKKFINFKNENSIQGEKVSETINLLINNGHTDEGMLKQEIHHELKSQFIKNCKCATITYLNGKTKKIQDLNFLSLDEAIEWFKLNKIYIFKGEIDLASNIFFKNIFFSGYFFEVAKSYLNSENISLNLSLFISENENKISNIDKEKMFSIAAQKYHFDIDYQKFFKIFVYFSDVMRTNDGSHIFIPGSHKMKENLHCLPKRYDDREIENSYKYKKEYLGKSGTFFFEDTFGIHKGSPILNDIRVMAVIEYGRQHFKLNELTSFN